MEIFNNFKKPLILLGYTKTTSNVIDNIITIPKEERKFDGIILIDNEIDIEFQHDEVMVIKSELNNKKLIESLNTNRFYCVVIFSKIETYNYQIADLRSVASVFMIENIDESIHTITEVNLSDNAGLILSKIKGDEVIIKELLDAKVIFSSIINHSISNYIYDILGNNNNKLNSEKLSFFGFNSQVSLRELKLKIIEQDMTLVGYGDIQNKKSLLFDNNDIVKLNDIIYFFNNN